MRSPFNEEFTQDIVDEVRARRWLFRGMNNTDPFVIHELRYAEIDMEIMVTFNDKGKPPRIRIEPKNLSQIEDA